jgi:hypothetical protein
LLLWGTLSDERTGDSVAPIFSLYTDRVENIVCSSTSIVACLSVAAGTCLSSRCLETNVVSEPFASNRCFSGSTVLALSKYGTILCSSLQSAPTFTARGPVASCYEEGGCRTWKHLTASVRGDLCPCSRDTAHQSQVTAFSDVTPYGLVGSRQDYETEDGTGQSETVGLKFVPVLF